MAVFDNFFRFVEIFLKYFWSYLQQKLSVLWKNFIRKKCFEILGKIQKIYLEIAETTFR
jgi:hypothetical protein